MKLKYKAGIKNEIWQEVNKLDFDPIGHSIDAYLEKPIKIHTIREDKNERWKVGTKIDFFINVRQKNMFRFAPVLPVVSTQDIEIEYTGSGVYNAWVFINGKLMNEKNLLEFAQNDGFDTIEDFFAYFNKDYTGKIIHWTDKRY